MIEAGSKVLAGKRIFVVEDNAIDLAVLSKPLTLHGALVYADHDNVDIDEHILVQLPLDLIVLDCQLRHGRDGYAVFAWLQRYPRIRSIPMVMITSLDPETEIPRAKSLGFAGFISKPIDALTISQHFADIICGQPQWIVSR